MRYHCINQQCEYYHRETTLSGSYFVNEPYCIHCGSVMIEKFGKLSSFTCQNLDCELYGNEVLLSNSETYGLDSCCNNCGNVLIDYEDLGSEEEESLAVWLARCCPKTYTEPKVPEDKKYPVRFVSEDL